ncbi:MAG: 3-oxoacyl-ACP synthase, partial [Myxococcales bacterium]|nr:3-oxoacyl-ACP synthase [Myxococcales bacterium]
RCGTTYTAMSQDVHPGDQVLFADGAGAVVLVAAPGERGLLAHHSVVDGSAAGVLATVGGGGLDPQARPRLHMNGGVVYRRAARDVAQAARAACGALGWPVGAVQWWVPHQANARVSAALSRRLGLAPERVIAHLAEVGNTSAASIPLALHAHRGRFAPGDSMVLCGLGAGLVATAVALRW